MPSEYTSLRVSMPRPARACSGLMAGVADLLRTTDTELYRAKEDGRNRVCVAG